MIIFDMLLTVVVSFFCAFITVGILQFIIGQWKKKKNQDKDFGFSKNQVIIIVSVLTILISGYSTMKEYWGTNSIGSFFERNEYTAQYYVNLFPEKDSSKNYRVKSDIRACFFIFEEYDSEGNDISEKQRAYLIEKAYFDNGGYITFFESNELRGIDNALKVGEKVEIKDDKGEDWWIELTSEKVK